MTLINRYIRSQVIRASMIVLLVFCGINFFTLMINELMSFDDQYTFVKVLSYVLLQLPAAIYVIFPVIAFIGSLMGLGQLAAGSELTVMRASGISIRQITGGVVSAALIMIVIMTFVGEIIAPNLQIIAHRIRDKATNASARSSSSPLWLRHGNYYIHVGGVISSQSIRSVTRFQFQGNALSQASFAKEGAKSKQGWQLRDVRSTQIYPRQTEISHWLSSTLPIHFNPVQIIPFENDSQSLNGSLWQLWRVIHERIRVGLVTNLYAFTFWERIIQPLTTMVMICLGVPFIFGSQRSLSVGTRMMISLTVGILFYMLNRFFGPISLIYQFPAMIAAFGPTLCFGLLYLYLTRKLV